MRRTFFASGLRFLRQDDVMGQIKATVNKMHKGYKSLKYDWNKMGNGALCGGS